MTPSERADLQQQLAAVQAKRDELWRRNAPLAEFWGPNAERDRLVALLTADDAALDGERYMTLVQWPEPV